MNHLEILVDELKKRRDSLTICIDQLSAELNQAKADAEAVQMYRAMALDNLKNSHDLPAASETLPPEVHQIIEEQPIDNRPAVLGRWVYRNGVAVHIPYESD